MSRKKKNSKKKDFDTDETGMLRGLKEETLQAVIAIIFLAGGIFFILAAFGSAGVAGDKIFAFVKKLLGIGYFLFPILCLLFAVSFFKSLHQKMPLLQLFGSGLFFLSGLGLIEILVAERGGLIGGLIAHPLVSLFAPLAAFMILFAVFVISMLVLLNDTLRLERLLFWKKKKEEGVVSTAVEDKAVATALKSMEVPEPLPPKVSGMADENRGEKDKMPKKEVGEAPDFRIKASALGLKEYVPPPLSLLQNDQGKPGVGDIKANANIIKRTLQNFGIIVEMDEITIGPSVTRYAFKPAEGVKLSKILGLQNNLELALAAHPVRIEAPIPGKSLVGIEVPNTSKAMIGLGSLLGSEEFQKSAKPLLMALGKGISGNTQFGNLAKMPHVLIAGATGSGKSVTIHALITSLLYRNSPENLKFIMVDPKRVELTLYNKIPHLLTPVITEPKKAILSLKWAAKEMERRYELLGKHQVRDIESYHKNILEPELDKLKKKGSVAEGETMPEIMPYIVVVIDELADIMQAYPRELEAAIVRLAQMSRAVGIHLVLSTQRPSVNIITGLIKANVPARIALQVVSFIDSRTILDTGGAEKLLGAGDMLYITGEMSKPVRLQSAFISENELKKVVGYLIDNYKDEIPSELNLESESGRNSLFESSLGDEDDDDELYEEAREIVMQAGKASTSFLQRKLRVGYARAARLMDILEERGVVGPGSGSKPRDVIGATPSEFGQDEEVT